MHGNMLLVCCHTQWYTLIRKTPPHAVYNECPSLDGVTSFAIRAHTTPSHTPIPHRSFYYAGAFDGGLELFYSQLVNGQQTEGGLFDRFLIQCMLFHHAVLSCPSYKGTSASFQLTSAARSQVSITAHLSQPPLAFCPATFGVVGPA